MTGPRDSESGDEGAGEDAKEEESIMARTLSARSLAIRSPSSCEYSLVSLILRPHHHRIYI